MYCRRLSITAVLASLMTYDTTDVFLISLHLHFFCNLLSSTLILHFVFHSLIQQVCLFLPFPIFICSMPYRFRTMTIFCLSICPCPRMSARSLASMLIPACRTTRRSSSVVTMSKAPAFLLGHFSKAIPKICRSLCAGRATTTVLA